MPGPFGGQSQQRWGDNTISAGEYLRDIMLTDLTGRPTGTGDARRKGMVLVAFFQAGQLGELRSNSPEDSEAMLVALRRLAEGYKESGKLTVLGVSQSNRETTKALADALGLKFPIMLDHEGYHAMVYGITTLPTAYLADGSGLVQRKMVGFRADALIEMSAKVAAFAEIAEPVNPFENSL